MTSYKAGKYMFANVCCVLITSCFVIQKDFKVYESVSYPVWLLALKITQNPLAFIPTDATNETCLPYFFYW